MIVSRKHSTKQRRKYRFLITAGGTREYIDPVRFISNASSGAMGCALVRAAVARGHKATLITTLAGLRLPAGVKTIAVESSRQMFAAVKKHLARCDCLIMAAAVADYTPVRTAGAKIKKSDKILTVKLKPTPDILKWAAEHKKVKSKKAKVKKQKIVVGFALEDRNLRALAEGKLKAKKLDMIVANSPAAIGAQKATVWIKIPDQQWLKIGPTTKRVIAGKLISLIEQLRA